MQPSSSTLKKLTIAALGVVYGDIGTSPLYAIKEVFANAHYPVPITPDNILGVLSLMLWSLIVVVSIKYVIFITRADNKGEGGIMALMALVLRTAENKKYSRWLMLLGLFGAALFYGDGAITPAISVLSAIEGLNVAAPALQHFVVPISLGVLTLLFVIQKHGTARVGALFGPITFVWFIALAIMGINSIINVPHVLQAVNPVYAVSFFINNHTLGFLSLGAVFLTLTGAEALYADMGHFGRRAVQLAWFGLVLPSLLLNYFGQGALLLAHPEAIENPFYLLAPGWALYPMIILATLATIIASQAVISGVYSITRQAMQLGYAPRMEVQHTSSQEMGQIYLPGINWALLAAVAVLVIGFGSSTNIAAAYGIAVSGTMIITTLLAFIVVRHVWKWSLPRTLLVLGLFFIIDIVFFAANAIKIAQGGWFPLLFAVIIFILMTTWKRGRELLRKRLASEAIPLREFVKQLTNNAVATVAGNAVFMTSNMDCVPHALLHSLKHYKSLHHTNVILTVVTEDVPYVNETERLTIEKLNDQFYKLIIKYGFMDEPDLPLVLAQCTHTGLNLKLADTSFFLGRETLIPRKNSDMPFWREVLFLTMFRNAGSAAAYFKLPPNRVVELGAQVEL